MKSVRRIETLDRRLLSGREYVGASRIDGPLIYVRNTHPIGYGSWLRCR